MMIASAQNKLLSHCLEGIDIMNNQYRFEVSFKNTENGNCLKGTLTRPKMSYELLATVARALCISKERITDRDWMPENLKIGTLWPFNTRYQVTWRKLA